MWYLVNHVLILMSKNIQSPCLSYRSALPFRCWQSGILKRGVSGTTVAKEHGSHGYLVLGILTGAACGAGLIYRKEKVEVCIHVLSILLILYKYNAIFLDTV